jgi:S-adenosylmethionine-dependent methyltransferase
VSSGFWTSAAARARSSSDWLGMAITWCVWILPASSSTSFLSKLAEESEAVRHRVRLHLGTLDYWPEAGENFDVVCCHGVVMYLPSLAMTLVAAARPGGLISVLAKNRANLPLRAAMKQDWEAALALFGAQRYTNSLGLEGTRADDPEEVLEALMAAGADTLAWYGVRLLTDHWEDVPPPDNFEVILQVEEQAGRLDPYRRLCSASHFIARRRS